MARRLVSRVPASRRRTSAAPSPTPSGTRSADVVLDVEVEHDRVHLVLVNCGDAVATAIRVEFSRALRGIGGSLDVSDLPVFTRLGVLRPGRALRVFWDAAPALLARAEDAAPFVATVSWDERARPRQRVEYHHDPSIYARWPSSIEPGPPRTWNAGPGSSD